MAVAQINQKSSAHIAVLLAHVADDMPRRIMRVYKETFCWATYYVVTHKDMIIPLKGTANSALALGEAGARMRIHDDRMTAMARIRSNRNAFRAQCKLPSRRHS